MCLILFAYRKHPRYKLILAANRDEFYNRPTRPAGWWEDFPPLLAGKDLKQGGTWLGVTRKGKIAALTNYRGREPQNPDAPSRGNLVRGFLVSETSPAEYMEKLRPEAAAFNGFNLLVGNAEHLYYYSNRDNRPAELEPGIYGLGNGLLNSSWPNVERGRELLAQLVPGDEVAPEELFALLEDRETAADERLPDTGFDLRIERALSAIFIETPEYGTLSSTVVLMDYDGGILFSERSFDPPGEKRDGNSVTRTESFTAAAP